MSQQLLIEDIGRVRRITLNAPERRNPLSFVQARDLLSALEQAAAAPEVSAVILTGAGSTFCVGGDQKDFQAGFKKRSPEVLSDYPPLEIFRLARNYRKPLIAAVNGAALGGGLGITCLAHMAVASETATFGIPEIKLGIFPLTVVPVVRPVLGDRLTYELSLTGRVLTAQEALQHNIVNKVVPAAELQQAALDMAAKVSEFSPLALRLGIEGLQVSADMDFEAAVNYLNAMRTIFFDSEDLLEGATAFLEKRKPVWQGR
ncbi:enoyl-CoA hydratase/isomerase family protein [Variovorax ureilyticus]|uniref:Enoyl-CoA hydratase/isomerase family protein n=1 Tax=Variovorax ureilyticus TaxID=1836198 RepID=A0ABU8VLX7_9BURK